MTVQTHLHTCVLCHEGSSRALTSCFVSFLCLSFRSYRSFSCAKCSRATYVYFSSLNSLVAAEILPEETRCDICSLGIAHTATVGTISFSLFYARPQMLFKYEREFLFAHFIFFLACPVSLSLSPSRGSWLLGSYTQSRHIVRVVCAHVNSWLQSTITRTDAIVCTFPGEIFQWWCWWVRVFFFWI